MIIPAEKLAGQNSAYRHRNYEGRFRKRRRPSLLSGNRRPERGFFAEEREDFFYQCIGCDAVLLAQDWNGAVLDELIGPTDPNDRRVDHLRVQMFHHRAAKTVVQNVVFNRADHVHAAREKFQSAGVHWLYPTRIDERNGNSFFFKLTCRFFGNFKHVAQAEDRHVAPVLHNLGLADLEKLRFRFDFYTRTGASRITNGDWTRVVVRHCPEHVDKLIFVL